MKRWLLLLLLSVLAAFTVLMIPGEARGDTPCLCYPYYAAVDPDTLDVYVYDSDCGCYRQVPDDDTFNELNDETAGSGWADYISNSADELPASVDAEDPWPSCDCGDDPWPGGGEGASLPSPSSDCIGGGGPYNCYGGFIKTAGGFDEGYVDINVSDDQGLDDDGCNTYYLAAGEYVDGYDFAQLLAGIGRCNGLVFDSDQPCSGLQDTWIEFSEQLSPAEGFCTWKSDVSLNTWYTVGVRETNSSTHEWTTTFGGTASDTSICCIDGSNDDSYLHAMAEHIVSNDNYDNCGEWAGSAYFNYWYYHTPGVWTATPAGADSSQDECWDIAWYGSLGFSVANG